jgi:hypothetical protein
MRFQDLFRGYTRAHGVSKPKGTKDARGKAEFSHFTREEPVTPEKWEGHLSGKGFGLGIIPLMDDNVSVVWGAIDIDRYNLDHAALEQDIAKLPLTLCKSKSSGGHLYLFLKEPASAALVNRRLQEWASALGWGTCEIFPKQSKRISKDDKGNWINLPYYGDSRKCVYQGEEVPLEKFLEIAESRQITAEILEKIQIVPDLGDGEFSDGPPCLQVLHKIGITEGGRNNALLNVGIYLKKKYPDEWQTMLPKWNEGNVDPPLPEIHNVVGTLEKKPYNYTCSKHPIQQHCNRRACVKRQYGIASGGDDELDVVLSGLQKIDTKEPQWRLNIDDMQVRLENTEQLMNQSRFAVLCVERLCKWIKPVTASKWREVVQDLLNNVVIEEGDPEASADGQFYLYLNNFIEIRQTENKDSLAMGNVWINEGKAYFRSQELYQYLRREGFRDLGVSEIYSLLKDLGVTRERFNIKGATVSAWAIPLTKLQSEAFDPPKFGDTVFGEDDGRTDNTGS